MGAGSSGLATAWIDPVAHIQAQDEAVYASIALGMASGNGWLTPKFLGRLALFKPPVLYWLSASAAKLLGPSAFALRLPSLLAGAGTATIVFLWVADQAPITLALAAALLAISSHLMFVLSRVAMTDGLLTFETLLAVWMLARDPRLERASSLWTFGFASGAAILTKGVAGVFPLLVLAILCVPRGRPKFARVVAALAITATVSAPWHVYQLARHPHWFWAEYVLTEHWTWGVSAPGQTTQEWQVSFYLDRLIALDPILVAVLLLGLGRVHDRAVRALIVVILAAVLAFQYRNAAYLMPLFPALAVAMGLAIPTRWSRAALAVTVALFAAKVLAPNQTWGLPFAPEFVNTAYQPLASYAAQHRGRELILIDPDDQFYSSTLGLKVRYVYLDARRERSRLPLDFESLGVTVTVDQFARLGELMPVFAEHLRAFDLDSTAPVATVILVRDEREIATLIASHADADFYVPARWADPDQGTHAAVPATSARVFLLAKP